MPFVCVCVSARLFLCCCTNSTYVSSRDTVHFAQIRKYEALRNAQLLEAMQLSVPPIHHFVSMPAIPKSSRNNNNNRQLEIFHIEHYATVVRIKLCNVRVCKQTTKFIAFFKWEIKNVLLYVQV